jgi:hypothetical protein
MNSYLNLILDAEGAKERLQRFFQSAPETEKNAGGSADNKHRCGNAVTPAQNPPQIFSIADIEAEQIERTSTRYSHGLIHRPAHKPVR